MQTIVGVKVRVLGDAVLDSYSPVPQVAVGVQYKTLGSTGLDGTLDALGTKRGGTESYASATKLLLGHGATLGGNKSKYSLQPEFPVASPVSKNVAVGAEYRFMRNRFETAARERAASRELCALGGEPCVYRSADMKTTHINLEITKSDFNALIEVLQRCMGAKGIPLSRQNQMLALLAPMHRDIITPQ